MICYQAMTTNAFSVSPQCLTEGRFAHPTDCGGFIDCLADDEGALVPRPGSCMGLAYHPDLGKCVEWNEYSLCHPPGNDVNGDARAFSPKSGGPVRSAMHDRLCETGLGFVCASCMEIIICIDGAAYVDPCPEAMRCELMVPFKGGVCYPSRVPSETCFCNVTGQVLPDVYDPRTFLFCSSPGRRPDPFHCPEHHMFDAVSETCVRMPEVPPCAESGVFPVAGRCRWYYSCTHLPMKGTFMQHFASCPGEEEVFSTTRGKCSDPYDLPLKDPCTKARERKVRYTCSVWGFLLTQLFPLQIANFCYS